MMELSEFLLARIAEDEAATWTLHPYVCEPGCCAPAGWVGSQCRYCDTTPHYGGTVAAITEMAEEHAEAIHQRSRVLAECEAKRRIVEVHPLTSDVVPVHTGPQPDVGCETCHTVTAASVMDPDYVEALGPCETLLALALPYADHPDYRQEWRP